MSRYIDIEPIIRGLELNNSKIKKTITDSDDVGSKYAEGFDCATSTILGILKAVPIADVVEIPEGGMGNLSDGYHTFNELYHHRAILFSVICNAMPDKAWKSKLHDTGDMYEGMFIVGIETPEGQATYHYDIEPYWDMFKVKELEKAPKWDGHTPQIAIDRISKLSADVEIEGLYRLLDDKIQEIKKLTEHNAQILQFGEEWEALARKFEADNKKLTKENETLTIQRNAWALAAKAIQADTVRKMESRLIDEVFKVARCQLTCDEPNVTDQEVRAIIKQIAKEMIGNEN